MNASSQNLNQTLTTARLHALVICLAVLIHLGHQWVYGDWYIEDAAICFAYARNIVAGEGIVPWPGGERIEGFSNPTWVLLLVLFQAVGVDGWLSSKLLAALFGAATVPVVWLVAREALPDDREGHGAVFAPLVIAASAPHAIWSASALENSLFNFLLILGIWRVLREADGRRAAFPWSAVVFLALAWTRPEGLLYAAVAGAAYLSFTLRAGHGLRGTIVWLAAFWVPYLALVGLRIWYFAWPLPNTYYAKLGVHDWHSLHRWYNNRGWEQIRKWSQESWIGYLLPVYVLGLTSTRGWRSRVGAAVIVGCGALLLYPGPRSLRDLWFWPSLPEPISYLIARIIVLTAVALLLPLVTAGGRGWRARVLCWLMVVVAVFFSIYSNGDWMRGLRWMSLFAPTAAVLFGVGVWEVAGLVARRVGQARWDTAGWMVAGLLVMSVFPPNITFSRWYYPMRDDYPEQIKRRVDHTTRFARMVFFDEPVRACDMDMGAHLWWGDQQMLDMAGLVDVPMSIHNFGQRDFIQEYVWDENRPQFVHAHLRWAEQCKYKTYPDFGEDFFRIQGYPDYRDTFHDGMYARRELVMSEAWDHPEDRRVVFARGVTLAGFDVPSPTIGQGRAFFIETGWQSMVRQPDDPFTVTAFLADVRGVQVSWDLPMGYASGFHGLPVEAWEPGEVFRGRFALFVPPTMPPGRYELGFLVMGAKGYVLKAGGAHGEAAVAASAEVGGRDGPARMAAGEVRFPGQIEVRAGHEVSDVLADERRIAALSAAWDGRCQEGEDTWRRARLQVPNHSGWAETHRPEIGAALARCWADRAIAEPDRAVMHLARAHRWDHNEAHFRAVASSVADAVFARGREARAAGDWEAAYRHFSDVITFAPTRSWARRYAEEARDHRLGLYDEQPWGTSFGPW